MMRAVLVASLVLLAPAAGAAEAEPEGDKQMSGMSIVGDHESPKSLVIVPWKSSDPGERLGVSRTLDDGPRPVDREAFVRQLEFYRIGVESWEGTRLESQ